MTETEHDWLECSHSYEMLEYLGGRATDRRLRLFACACCRKLFRLLTNPQSREAVEASERYADGLISMEGLSAASRLAPHGQKTGGSWTSWNKVRLRPTAQAERSVIAATQTDAPEAAWETARESMTLLQGVQCDILRDIFVNPFRPVTHDPTWLTWKDGTIPKLARAIYEERAFERMPILGDALEEAGCDEEAILAHCHEPGEHVRGCWVVDALLGKR